MPLRIRDRIFRDILSGVWQDSGQLPGATALAKRYNAGYCSTVEALRMLGQEGVILRRRGRRSKIISGPRRSYQVGIIVDDVNCGFPPFDYNYAPVTWIRFNVLQQQLISAGFAGLSIPPDLDCETYLPQLDAVIVLRDTDGNYRFKEPPEIPAVYCYNQKPDHANGCYNYVDYTAAVEKAGLMMICRGAKNFCIITTPNRCSRFAPIEELCSKYSGTSCCWQMFQNLYDVPVIKQMIRDLLYKMQTPTAFFILSDQIAEMLLQAALERHLQPGQDIHIISCGNLPQSAVSQPPLSVIATPFTKQAATAVQQLQNMLCKTGDPAAANSVVSVSAGLIVRKT